MVTKVKEIIIAKAEGQTIHVGVNHRAFDWSEADDVLFRLARTAPIDGGYDKTDFTVSFEDNFSYSGTLDLKHNSIEIPSLKEHIKSNLTFNAGISKPSWMADVDYQRYLMGSDIEGHKYMLRTYIDDTLC